MPIEGFGKTGGEDDTRRASAKRKGVLISGEDRLEGELLLGGVACSQLASAYGTPVLALDYDVLDGAITGFLNACKPHGFEIAYAGKALLLVALAKHLKHTPLNLDVCSLGELLTAEAAGFPAERITLHGCGKTGEEIEAALAGRVGRIVVDNAEELAHLAAAPAARTLDVLLRINTGIEAHTHEFVRTSGQESKFGFDPQAVPAALGALHGAGHLRFCGLHSHIGSQIYEERAFAANAQALMDIAAQCAAASFPTTTLIAGGGFGVPERPGGGEGLDIAATVQSIAQTVTQEAARRGLPAPVVGLEPGRALVAAAGTSLYTVVAAKRQFGRAYAIVDGGMYENPRPALYGAYHHMACASREGAQMIETVVCGRS